MDVIIYCHTHWDREWYKTFEEYRLRFCEVFDEITSEIAKGNINCFYLDGQTIILEDYFEIYPENIESVKDLISQKKLVIGPWYALADEFLVSGESLIRNLQIGIKQAKNLGCTDFTGYLPDSFGHNSEIPRILDSFGIKNAVLWRGAGDNKSEFVWKCSDGSAVTATYLTEGYFQDVLHYNTELTTKSENLKKLLDKLKYFSAFDFILLPIGADHLGPVLNLKEQLDIINPLLKDYNLKQGNIISYLQKINTTKDLSEEVGELRNNTRNPVLAGVYSTRLYLKQENAKVQWLLSKIAEPLQTFMQYKGLAKNKYNELNHAWKLLLKNHPHDSICGCSIDQVHREMMPRFDRTKQLAKGLIDRCLDAIAQNTPEKNFAVINLSNNDFSGVVKIKTADKLPDDVISQFISAKTEFPSEILLDTQRVPFSEDMREFSEYLVYADNINAFSINTIIPAVNINEELEITERLIKNSLIKLEVNNNGSFKFTDFQSNKEFDNIHILHNRADIGDSYTYSPITVDVGIKASFTKAEILEKGPLRATLRLFYEMEIPFEFDELTEERSLKTVKTSFITDIQICAGSKRAEFITSFANESKDHILQLKFKFNEPVKETFAENTFGIIKREFDPEYSLKKHIPAQKQQELKTNTAPMQRFVYVNGLGIITEGLNEYGVSGNQVYITALRSVGKLSKPALNTRNFPAGPPLETPEAQCLGEQTIRYAICAAENPVELFKESDEFYGNILTVKGLNNTQNNLINEFNDNLIKLNNLNIYTYSIKLPDDKNKKGAILRLMNLSETEQIVKFSSSLDFSNYTELDSLENIISEKNDFSKSLMFNKYELKTVLIEY